MQILQETHFAQGNQVISDNIASFSKGCETMADSSSTEKAPKKNFWKGMKAEYKKIVWPNRDTVTKQTIVVLVVSLVLGVLIGVLDMIFKFGINLII